MKLRIGSRDSALAVVQSRLVMDALQAAHPDLELELVTMKTTGDKILDRTLDKVGGKGLFVKELDVALREGRVDLTVHSCKDLPMETPADLPIAAFLEREDPRDVLVLPEGALTWDVKLPVGSASPRRRVQLRERFPGLAVQPVRGNIQTRLRKLERGDYGGLILAAAGILRLGLEHRIRRYFDPEGRGFLRFSAGRTWIGRFSNVCGTGRRRSARWRSGPSWGRWVGGAPLRRRLTRCWMAASLR